MSGGGSDVTNKTVADPWEGAQGYLKDLLAQGSSIAGSQTGEDYQKEFVGLTPEQLTSISDMQRYYGEGGGYQKQIGGAQSALETMLRDPSVAATSPETQAMVQAAQNPMMAQLQEQILPGVRAGATGAGQYGSTRQGVAEGVATGKTQEAMGNAAAKIQGDVYQKALLTQLQAAQMAPGLAEAGAAGSKQQIALGDLLRANEQGQLDIDQYNKTMADWGPLQQWSKLLYPAAGLGGTTTATQTGGGPGTAQSMLGAGMTGLGAYSSLAGMGGAAAGAAGPVGIGAGLLALLASR